MLRCDICDKYETEKPNALKMHQIHCKKRHAAQADAPEPEQVTVAPDTPQTDDYAELGLTPVKVTREQIKGKKLYAKMGDDRLHDRWVPNNAEKRREHEQLGYRVARAEEVVESSGGVAPDGSVVTGDTVLMTCLKRDKQSRDAERAKMNEEMNRRMRGQHSQEADGNLYIRPEDSDYAEVKAMEANRRPGTKMFNIPINLKQ